MDVRLTDEHRLLVATADAIARAAAPATPSAIVPGDGWEALAAAGLTSLRGPDGSGGSGLDAVLVTERLAAHLCPAPFLGPTLAAELGAAPDERATVVLDEQLLGLGSALAIDAAGAVVGVGVDDAGELVRFDLGPAVEGAADLTRPLRPVTDPPRANLRSNRPPTTANSTAGSVWTALALTLAAADLVGVMDGAIDLAVEHAMTRHQFDRPIGSFQAVQHLLADAHVSREAARSAVWHAAWAVDELDPPAAVEAARVAKAYASRVGPEVCETAIQVLGGIGMTWESRAHAFLRRARFDAAVFGDETAQLQALAAA